jgi:hypothetical protein
MSFRCSDPFLARIFRDMTLGRKKDGSRNVKEAPRKSSWKRIRDEESLQPKKSGRYASFLVAISSSAALRKKLTASIFCFVFFPSFFSAPSSGEHRLPASTVLSVHLLIISALIKWRPKA